MGRLVRNVQTSFTAGELDPLLAMRRDMKHYYNGGERLRNVLIEPQGGVKRRPGLEYMATIAVSESIDSQAALERDWWDSEPKPGVVRMWKPPAVHLVPFQRATETHYLNVVTDKNLAVYRNGEKKADVAIPHTAAQLLELTWTQSLDTLILFHPDVPTHKVMRTGSDTAWSSAPLAFKNIPTRDFGSGGEPAWSAARGWPGCGTFHQSRLIVAGSRSLPQTVWGSKSGDFFDFKKTEEVDGKILDDQGFEVTLNADTVSAIKAVYSGRHLQLFTSDGVWYCPIGNEALTPSNIMFKRAARRGCKTMDADGAARTLPTIEVDGAVLFVQRGGKALRELLWVDTEADYVANNISLLSSHVIDDPTDIAIRRSTSTEEADYVPLVNRNGTLAVLCTLRNQDIAAWSLCSTRGKFLAVGVDGEWMYFAVERYIPGDRTFAVFLERFNVDCLMDSSFRSTRGYAAGDVKRLEHLEGRTVRVRADNALRESAVVTNGKIALDRAAEKGIEVGIDFPTVVDADGAVKPTPLVRDMPLEMDLPDGPSMGRKKRVVEIYLRLYKTQGLKVNGQSPVFWRFGPSALDAAPEIYTGDKTIKGMLGWDDKGQVEITQADPLPLAVLGIGKKVAI